MIQYTFGTKEWAEKNCNFIRGCSHDCLYCYAKEYAIKGGRCTPEQWKDEAVVQYKLTAPIKPQECSVMFPSSHDITPQHLPQAIAFLKKLLVAYPSVLVVTKPHYECVVKICGEFRKYIDKLTFRFTIGSASDAVLKFWEPNAPALAERLASLEYACRRGYKTSVSCEPMLDNNIEEVIGLVRPFVTDSIWLGKANNLIERLVLNGHNNPETMAKAEELLAWQSTDNIRALAHRLKDEPLIRLKQSIKNEEVYAG